MARNKSEIVKEIRPIQGLVFVFHLEYHRGDRGLQIVHTHYYGLQGRVQLFLLPLHRTICITLYRNTTDANLTLPLRSSRNVSPRSPSSSFALARLLLQGAQHIHSGSVFRGSREFEKYRYCPYEIGHSYSNILPRSIVRDERSNVTGRFLRPEA